MYPRKILQFRPTVHRTGCRSQLEGLDKWTNTQSGVEICAVSGKEYGVGVGTHKHLARGAAAALALEALKAEPESEGGDKLE
ncbi:hypothetical protein JVT61DRAFT_5205 [Boletus reticuloceps]|uniref:DRBM domain-containing protein n=1 Tax=Boletus reticuloceps TaxID=495285 RepID=A0A8I2YZ83_9AGAM|nr:hypothetical protein JVT61DRAFT_5205 [Boletus reticuloceps]